MVTTRLRLLTSLMAAAGSPGGSVHASVMRSGWISRVGVGHGNVKCLAVAGGQRIGGTLILNESRTRHVELIGDSGLQGGRQIDQAPASGVYRFFRLKIIKCHVGARAVDEHRLEQGRAGQRMPLVGEKVLHQRQHARHVRRRHARAGFVAVIRRLRSQR